MASNVMARWLGRQIATLAQPYLKQQQRGGGDGAMAFFGGEAPLLATLSITDEDWERLAITSEWVMSDIRTIANICAQARLNVYERQGEDEVAVTDHEFERLSRSPMQNLPEGTFRMAANYTMTYTFQWWLLRGEAYWLRLYDSAGRLAGWLPLPSSRLEPIPDGEKYISGFSYTPKHGRGAITFPTEQICFFRFPNPFDYHRGLSLISAYRYAIETDDLARKWGRDTFKKEATLRTILSLSESLAEPVYRSRKAELMEAIENQLRFIITQGKDLTATPFSMSPKDLEFLNGRAFSRDIVDRMFGFSEGYWSESANRATADTHKAILIENTCWPLLQAMASDITSQMIVPTYGPEYLVRFDDIRIADRQMEVAEATQYWQVAKLNEARAERGKKEYDGPLADIIGELPVPLAVNPQFVMSMGGITPTVGPGGGSIGGQEMRADLRRWKSIELRRLAEGQPPGSYDFESDWLPVDNIRAALEACQDEAAVRSVFDGGDWLKEVKEPFVPKGAGKPLLSVPDEVQITDEDVDKAIAFWDRAMPDCKGMLEATVEGLDIERIPY